MESILTYFPGLTPLQRERFAALYDLYADWNAKINVVSRKGPRPSSICGTFCIRWASPKSARSTPEPA